MADSVESNSVENEAMEKDSSVSGKLTEVHPLAFTIEFDDQKFDESRKSKVHERLSAFSLKHRRNPSLPDFGVVKNAKNSPPVEFNSHVPIINKGLQKTGKPLETQWKSSALKAVKAADLKAPLSFRGNLGVKEDFIHNFKMGRRNSLNDIDDGKSSLEIIKNGAASKADDIENKSDTVSEAGTYTVDKDEENGENDCDRTHILEDNKDSLNGVKKNYHSSWINDWVRDVEEQNMLNPAPKEPPPIHTRSLENGAGSPGASKIPSPINTLSRKAKARSVKPGDEKMVTGKLNGSVLHRRSSSLSAKDYNENHGSESSLETESFLRTTESVMASMQNRMRLSLDGRSSDQRKTDKRNFNYRERPHPPSTASDTDTNSETDAKTFKKPIGNPFTSARLNRAFSLRRAKADPEKDLTRKKAQANNEPAVTSKQTTPAKAAVAAKPPSSTPFSRLDCGRFSMRSTISSIRSNIANQVNPQKKDAKKANTGTRSTSSLSSREVEFQNWRRRKSFDPMKAAAEGRKKELAKKAAMNQSMTQSVNLGNGTRTRSGGGNPVLRSASFHSTAQVLAGEEEEVEGEEFQDQGSTDEQEESASSSWLFNHHSLPHNSPTQACVKCKPTSRTPVFSSRCSLISETHSSPSRRVRSDDLENLVMSAISDLSYKLKLKSCNLLKKLNYLYDPGEEKAFRLRDEIAVLESRPNSAKNSPIHQTTSRDLSAILKNLKGLENVFNVLEDVLFDENIEIYTNE